MTSISNTMEYFSTGLRTSLKVWFCLYITLILIYEIIFSKSFSSIFLLLHICLILVLLWTFIHFRLPRPDSLSSLKFLGSDPRNYDGNPPSKTDLGVIAHRAAGLDGPLPENSIEAVQSAKAKGCKCIEFDVSFSSDGVAFVFHDDTVDRMCVNGTGLFRDKPSDEIRKLRIKNKDFSEDEDNTVYKIPTVLDFVQECLRLEMKVIVDLKSYEAPEATAKFILDLYKENPSMYTQSIITSFYPHLIYAIRRKDPNILCAMSWRPYYFSYDSYTGNLADSRPRFDSFLAHFLASLGDVLMKWALHEFLWCFLGLSAVLIQKEVMTPGYLQFWREKGVRVITWTVNNSIEKLNYAKNMKVAILSDILDSVSEESLLANIDE